MAEAAEAVLFAEGWQFFWLAWVVLATLAALARCSWPTCLVAFMLLAGWLLTNVFWQMPAVYAISDVSFGAVTFGLWHQHREPHLLFVATMYASMLVVHAIQPDFPEYMLALNALFGSQLAAVSRAAYRGAPGDSGGQGRAF